MTTNRPPFDATMLAALAVLSVMFALVAFGCDQPPKSDRPEPISVTEPIGTALDDVSAIPPLGEQVKRNRDRFPNDFAFQLTAREFAGL
jgi:hypothetical protein